MIDLQKSLEIFNPSNFESRVHIIGCGSVGSTIADLIARLGVRKITLWDNDKVELKNMPNSMLYSVDDGRNKTDTVEEMIKRINPECDVVKKGWFNPNISISGIVFLCVDNIDLRREIVKANMMSNNVKAFFDIRTGLYTAQGYAASTFDQKKAMLKTMDFTHDEVKEERSACGATLGLASVVRIICAAQVHNFINFNKTKELKTSIQVDLNNWEILAF